VARLTTKLLILRLTTRGKARSRRAGSCPAWISPIADPDRDGDLIRGQDRLAAQLAAYYLQAADNDSRSVQVVVERGLYRMACHSFCRAAAPSYSSFSVSV
jgi:hypothetical protein